jgi:peroxiredoxin
MMMNIRPLVTLGLLASAIAVTLAGCERPEPDTIRALRPGDAAPAYAAPAMAGDTVVLADLRGEAVMLNIWATWCAPCREEMPGLQQLHETYADAGLRVIGVSIDASGLAGEIRHFTEQYGISFTILHDPAESVMRAFRARAVPETFLIDREGRVVRRWIGKFDPVAEDSHESVRRALGQG